MFWGKEGSHVSSSSTGNAWAVQRAQGVRARLPGCRQRACDHWQFLLISICCSNSFSPLQLKDRYKQVCVRACKLNVAIATASALQEVCHFFQSPPSLSPTACQSAAFTIRLYSEHDRNSALQSCFRWLLRLQHPARTACPTSTQRPALDARQVGFGTHTITRNRTFISFIRQVKGNRHAAGCVG